MAGDALELEGTVTTVHRADLYRITVEIGEGTREVIARRSGKLNTNRIKIVAGDRVRVEVSPYDVTRGRIVYRL